MNQCMQKYGFRDWDSVLAAIGRGALKEGQIIDKLIEEYEKERSFYFDYENICA